MSLLGELGLVAAAYLIGSIPSGVVVGRLLHHTDLRDHGSGSTGTTNAYRVLGGSASLLVLAIDLGKGVVPVLAARLLGADSWVIGAVAVAAIVGHCWSIFIGFDGGKGVATGAGAVIAMWPWMALVVVPMLAAVAATRYVSLASIVGALSASLLALIGATAGWIEWPIAFAIWVMAAVVIGRHRTNIERLLTGTERKLRRSTGRPGQKPA